MKVRLVNYKKLAFGYLKKSQIADNQRLYKLSSKYFSLAHKIFRVANTELLEKIDNNKNVIRELNRQRLSNFIEDDPNKEEIYALFQSLEFPYEVNFGDTSQEYNKTKIINLLYTALELINKNVNADVALALIFTSGQIGGRSIEEKANLLLQELETTNQKYGFIENRRMNFRTPTLLIDIYLGLDDLAIPLDASRSEYLNLLYSQGEDFTFDKEHFDSALNLNYIFGKHSIPFVQKCHTESNDTFANIPHNVDNILNFNKLEYDPKITEFIVKNYFNINLRRDIENKLRSEVNLSEEEIKKYTNDILSSDSFVTVKYRNYSKSEFLSAATTKLRSDISSVISSWHRPIRIQGEEFKPVSELSNMPIEKLCKIITQDIAAEDIGYENITNERLFQAMVKYQKDDIKSFLRVQRLVDERPEESEWYTDLTKSKVENDSYIARVLPKHDPRFPFVGAITGCCQKIHGAGNSAFLNTFGPDSGILIVTDKKDNIVAQSYIWINGTSVSLDSIESQYITFNHEDFKDIYQKACNEIFSKYFDVVLCGNNNTKSSFSNAEKLIPLDIFKNNDPNHYTLDTSGGRRILFAKPEAANKYPMLSIFEKVNNNLNESYIDEEIEIIINNNNIKNSICHSLVNKYINDLEDTINKENLLKLYNQLGRPTFPEDFMVMCILIERPELVDFDVNLNKTQFQISLNTWLRQGNLLNATNDENQKEKIKQEIAKIDSFNYPTKLYKYQKLISPNCQMTDSEKNNFFYEMKDEDKNYLLSKIPQIMSLRQFLGEKINLEKIQYLSKVNEFTGDLLYTYIQNNQLSNDDIKFVNDNMFKRSWDLNEIPTLIKSGFIEYFFKPLDGGSLIPNFDIVKSIASYVKNISQNQNFGPDDEKLKPIIKEIIDNSDSYPISSDTNYTLGTLVNNCLQSNFVDLNINNRNIQKLLSSNSIQDKIPQEINTLYLSNYNFISRMLDHLSFAHTLNIIVDYPYTLHLNLLKNVNSIQHINVKAQHPVILSSVLIRSFSEASDDEIIYDKKDLLKMIDNELKPDTMKRSLYSAVDNKENSFRTNIKQRILEMLRYSLSDIPNQINNMLPEIDQLMDVKINQLINDLRNDTSTGYNKYYVDKFLEHEKIQTPPAQPEEQNEITASNKRRLKYSIKIK